MVDSFSREINYARISLTDRCNLRCKYCMPQDGVEKKTHNDILRFEQILKIINALEEIGINKIRFTGGEPLIRKGVDDFIVEAKNLHPDISFNITTNAIFLPNYIDKIKSSLSHINVSLDTLDKEIYQELSKGNIEDALKGIECAYKANVPIKMNAVLLKGINDSKIEEMIDFASKYDAEMRFIELMPFACGNSYEKYGISADEVIKKYNMKSLNEYSSTRNAEKYSLENGKVVSFIRPLSNKFCKDCNRIRLTADGNIIPCLHHSVEIPITEFIEDKDKLKEELIKCIMAKPLCHNLNEGELQNRPMNKIGG